MYTSKTLPSGFDPIRTERDGGLLLVGQADDMPSPAFFDGKQQTQDVNIKYLAVYVN